MITKLFIRLQPEDKRYGQPADRASYTGVYRANLLRAAYPILLYFFPVSISQSAASDPASVHRWSANSPPLWMITVRKISLPRSRVYPEVSPYIP